MYPNTSNEQILEALNFGANSLYVEEIGPQLDNVLGVEAISEFTDKSLFKERLEIFHQNSIRSAKPLIAFAHC